MSRTVAEPPAAPPPAPPANPAPAPAPPASAEARQDQQIAELRTEQQRQGGVLEEIRGMLTRGTGDPGAAPPVRGDPPPAPDLAEQVKEAVRAVNAEQAAAGPAKPKPEKRPREVGQPFRQRLQKTLFGGE